MRLAVLAALVILISGCSLTETTHMTLGDDRLAVQCSVDGLDHDRCIELAMQGMYELRAEVPGTADFAVELRGEPGAMVIHVCATRPESSASDGRACREYPADS
jgi:hypothetical protein